MNRKIFALNLVLAMLVGLLVWQLHVRRVETQAREQAVLAKAARTQAVLPPPPPAAVPPVAPADYLDTVQKMLFAKDRNPNVIVDPPKPPPPPPAPKPMPALPRYYGQIRFGGDPVVILSSPSGSDQKGYAAGDKIGEFKVVSFERESPTATITFDWNGQEVVRNLADLKAKAAQPQQASAQMPTNILPPAPVQHEPPPPPDPNLPPVVGNDLGGGFYGCKADDKSPSGTIVGGYQKSSAMGLMGATCRWEKVKQ